MPRPRALVAMLLLMPWLAACAPALAPPGPGATQPAIAERPLGPWRWTTADGYELVLRRWGPERPAAVILALHGFNDHSTFIADAAADWAEQGIATYAYDQRGFGNSPNRGYWAGTAAYAGDAAALAALLARRHPGAPIYLLGESMGGAIAMVTALRHPEAPIAGLVLSAPAVWSRSTMPFYQRWSLLLATYTVPWFPLSGEGLDLQASDNLAALRALAEDPLVIKRTRVDAVHGLVDLMDEALAGAPELALPALLLYGAKDELVPADPMFDLWRNLPTEAQARQRQALYENGWHLLFKDLDADLVIADVAAWISAPDEPLPSGADRQASEALATLAD